MAHFVTSTYPVTPTTTPPKATLLQTANVSDAFANLNVADALFDSYNCMRFESDAVFCAPNNKTFDNGVGWQSGFRFAAYGGAVCKAIGLDQDRMRSEVERVFNQGESTAVERALMETRFRANGTVWLAPTDITPGAAAVPPAVGLALLESHAASLYVGVPTLHLPKVIVSLILVADGAAFEGDLLFTKLGSKIVAGAGYDYPNTGPTGAVAAAGEKWLYATGEVVVVRGPAVVQQAMAESTNEVFVLGERGYVVAVDCYASAVRVTVTA